MLSPVVLDEIEQIRMEGIRPLEARLKSSKLTSAGQPIKHVLAPGATDSMHPVLSQISDRKICIGSAEGATPNDCTEVLRLIHADGCAVSLKSLGKVAAEICGSALVALFVEV
jgi:hypothetical protein